MDAFLVERRVFLATDFTAADGARRCRASNVVAGRGATTTAMRRRDDQMSKDPVQPLDRV
jgi:hypothetical protein